MNSPLKKIYKFFLILFIIFLLLITGAYVYVKVYLPKDTVKNYILLTVGKNLDRNIQIENVKFNIFKGIILENVSVSRISNVENSAEFSIEEVSLKYDFNALFHFKFLISKLVLYNFNIDIQPEVIDSEISYYKNKFSSDSKNTNSSKFTFDIKFIELRDTRIKYNNIEFLINSINFQNSVLKKINNDICIIINNKKIFTSGYVSVYKHLYKMEQNVKYNNIPVNLKLDAADFTNINFKIKSKLFKKNLAAIGKISYVSNVLFNEYLNIYDTENNNVTLKNFFLYLDTLKFKTKLIASLPLVDRNLLFINDNAVPYFSGSVKLNVFLRGKFKNILKNLSINGGVEILKAELSVNTNKKVLLQNGKINIRNNKAVLDSADVFYDDLETKISGEYRNIFGVYPVKFKLTSNFINLEKFIKKDLIVNKTVVSGVFNIPENHIKITSAKLNTLDGIVLLNGGYFINNGLADFSVKFKKVSLNKLKKIISYTNRKLSGNIRGSSKLSFSINKRFRIKKLEGSVTGDILYDSIKSSAIIKFSQNDNEIRINNSFIKVFNNKVKVSGVYNLLNNNFKVAGTSSVRLGSLGLKELKGISDVSFSVSKAKTLNGTVKIYSDYIDWNKFKFYRTQSEFSFNDKLLFGSVRVKNFYKGNIVAFITNNFSDNGLKVSGKGNKIRIGSLLKNRVTGDISGNLDFNFDLHKKDENYKGNLYFNVSKGEIADTEFQKGLGGFLGLLEGLEDIFYNNITGVIQLNNNNVNIKSIKIICPDQKYFVAGKLGLDGKYLNIDVQPQFNEEFVKNVPNFALQVLSKKNNWYYIQYINITSKNEKLLFRWKK